MIVDREGVRFCTDQIIILFLFLFALDFLDLSGMLIAGTIVLFLFLHFTELKFDANAGILVLFSCFYFASVAYYEGLALDVIIKFALAPWGTYLLGYNMRLNNRSISVTDFSFLIAFGFFLHGMLNLYSSIQVFGASFNNNYRQAFDFWQSRIISVTTASLYYTPFTVMAIGGLFSSRGAGIKLLCAVSLGLALFGSMIYQNRTLILACGLVACLNVLLVMRDKEMPTEKKKRIYSILVFLALAAAIAFLSNVAGIQDAIMNSSLMNRMSGDKQDRTTIWFSFIFGDAWKYPFGGTKAVLYDNKPFVHNTWLDTFRRAGLLPFLLLSLFTLRAMLDTIKFGRLGRLTGEDAVFLISLLAGTMLSFFVEPVIEANPYVFYLPLFVLGLINGHNRDIEEVLDSAAILVT